MLSNINEHTLLPSSVVNEQHEGENIDYYTRMMRLLEKGANPNATTKSGWSALQLSIVTGQKEIIKLMKIGPSSTDDKEKHIINVQKALANLALNGGACDEGDSRSIRQDKIELLLAYGADPNFTTIEGWSPLLISVLLKQEEATKLLLKCESNPNITTHDGCTPLHYAAQGGYTELASLLIKQGADVNARNTSWFTALCYATQRGHTEIASLLIKQGADVDARNARGHTPMHYAFLYGYTEVFRLLKQPAEDRPYPVLRKQSLLVSRATAQNLISLTDHKEIAKLPDGNRAQKRVAEDSPGPVSGKKKFAILSNVTVQNAGETLPPFSAHFSKSARM